MFMKYSKMLAGAVLSSAVLFGSPSHSPALMVSPSALLPAIEDSNQTITVARRGGFAVRGGGAFRRGGVVRGGAVVRGGGYVVRGGGAVVRGGGVVVRRPGVVCRYVVVDGVSVRRCI